MSKSMPSLTVTRQHSFERRVQAEFESQEETVRGRSQVLPPIVGNYNANEGFNSSVSSALRPSTTARRENFKKGAYKEQFEAQDQLSRDAQHGCDTGKTNDGQDGGALESWVLESFPEEVAAVISDINQAFVTIRFEHLQDSKGKASEKERLAREEARRRRETEARRLRKAEQDTRTPKKKVALKLEKRRKFGEDGVGKSVVPNMMINVHSNSGVERIEVVDVQEVKNRAPLSERLAQGASIAEVIKMLDKIKASAAAAALPTRRDIDPLAPLTNTASSWNTRSHLAHVAKDAYYAATLLHRIQCMRGNLPDGAADSLMSNVRRLCTTQTLSNTSSSLDFEQDVQKAIQRIQRRNSLTFSSPSNTRSSLRHSLGTTFGATFRAMQARRRWSLVRSAARVCMLLFWIRRRARYINHVKNFIQQLGESARIKSSVVRYCKNIRKIQHAYRNFVAFTTTRVDVNEDLWQKFEEKVLPGYVEAYTDYVIEERLAQFKNKNSKSLLSNAQIEREAFYRELGENARVPWQSLCIPPKISRALIKRLYIAQLRRKARQQVQHQQQQVMTSLDENQDIMLFKKAIGALDESDCESEPHEETHAELEETAPLVHRGSALRERKTVRASAFFPDGPGRKTVVVHDSMSPGRGPKRRSLVGRSPRKRTLVITKQMDRTASTRRKQAELTSWWLHTWWQLTVDELTALMAFAAQSLAHAVGLVNGFGEKEAMANKDHWLQHPGNQPVLGGYLYQPPRDVANADFTFANAIDDTIAVHAVVCLFDHSRLEQRFARRHMQMGGTLDGSASNPHTQLPNGGEASVASSVRAPTRPLSDADLKEVLDDLTPRLREIAGKNKDTTEPSVEVSGEHGQLAAQSRHWLLSRGGSRQGERSATLNR
jgi:hypothetical protein